MSTASKSNRTTHTPGPWRAQKGHTRWSVRAGRAYVAYDLAMSGSAHEEANARLMAAAPTMKEFILKWIGDGALQTFEDRERFRAEARAVLANAEAR